MDSVKVSSPKKTFKALEITRAYAEYKIRRTGDLDADLSNWVSNITRLIAVEKAKKSR